jgi:hypothetical protein
MKSKLDYEKIVWMRNRFHLVLNFFFMKFGRFILYKFGDIHDAIVININILYYLIIKMITIFI